jgi:hypothetical protein
LNVFITKWGKKYTPGSTTPFVCENFDHPPTNVDFAAIGEGPVDSLVQGPLVVGQTYFYFCFVNGTAPQTAEGSFVFGVTSPGTRAWVEAAAAGLDLGVPDTLTSPPRDGPSAQTVGFRTFLWLAPDQWHDQVRTAQVQDLVATITAQPISVTWDMGNGDTVTCPGPGTPYDPEKPESSQGSPCSYIYQHDSGQEPDGAYTVTTAVTWNVSWTTNEPLGADSGTLPSQTRAGNFPLVVHSYQAIIVPGP